MSDFSSISQDFKNFVLSNPDTSMGLGNNSHLDQLADPSLEQLKNDTAQAKTLLVVIENCSTDDFNQQLDIDLMARYLKQQIFFAELEQDGQPQRCRKPGGVDGISEGIFQLFVNDERSPEARLDNILSRLQQAPAYLKVEADVITQPIQRWRDIEVEQGEGLPDLFATIYNWAEKTEYPKSSELQQAIIACNSALGLYLNDLKRRQCLINFDIGEDKVNELLALRNINLSPVELVKMARDFMANTQTLLTGLNKRLCKKYDLDITTSNEDLHEYLNDKFSAKIKNGELNSVLDYYSDQIKSINEFIEQRHLFSIPAQQEIRLLQTPSFLEPVIPAGAMWPPLALRPGKKTSLVYLTLKEDQLAEHTELGIPVMMIHEGIPGHHLQFATAAQHPSFIRRIFSANEHAEGWTTMLEDYMLDVGYISEDLVDEVRFIAKREMSRLVARVGIDLYFMTGERDYLDVGLDLGFKENGYSDDVFVNAAKLLKKATGFTDGRVQAELNWYSSEQSYPLSYLTGNRLVWQLKQDIQAANKKDLGSLALDQAFHKVYLESGCMPVESLRTVYEHEGFL
ncbi:MAG: DUF885 family protein [Oleispira antarctica]|uniref:DUF885 domain-containing protein n=1 Tax=Oleispira antarctica RB-8 TaxID=698738 RepID=R4YVA4_OLEAN|nr:DUF885 family protein [Oleispira antarctica]MBQ0792289.1 DUF885 family protein [Oleispira antarctica]CCK77854.1 conserved hypothetical protein [Oleispira antarctica RB-8]|tara:strand:- start:3094 stop:4803 length:1710 start_codon:yes stop_codon:yes gene_type:complete